MTAFLLLAVALSALPASDRDHGHGIRGSVDGGRPLVRNEFRLRKSEKLLLSFGPTNEVASSIPGPPGRGGPFWYRFEPVRREYSNLGDPGRLNGQSGRVEPIDYVKIPLVELDGRAEIDFDRVVPPDVLGTFYIGVDVLGGGVSAPTRPDVISESAPLHLKYSHWIIQVTRRADDSYIGYLTELFRTPFIIAPKITEYAAHETESRIGSDCAAFAIYGKRQQGYRVPYCGPFWIHQYLNELAGSPAAPASMGSRVLYVDSSKKGVKVGAGGLEPGDIVHFGEQVSVFYADAGVTGVLDEDDLLIQCYLAGPEIKRIKDSGFAHRRARLFKWRTDLSRLGPGR
jgi:hypothetical protein